MWSIYTIKVTNNCCLDSNFSANMSCGLRLRLKLTMRARLLARTANSEWTFRVRNLLKLHIQKAIILLSASSGNMHQLRLEAQSTNNLLGEHKIYALENQVILQSSHLLLFFFLFFWRLYSRVRYQKNTHRFPWNICKIETLFRNVWICNYDMLQHIYSHWKEQQQKKIECWCIGVPHTMWCA